MNMPLMFCLAVLVGSGCQSGLRQRSIGGLRQAKYEPKVEVTIVDSLPASDTMPVVRIPVQVAIGYPFTMMRARIEGEVLATLSIGADGLVRDVVVKTASQQEFAQWITEKTQYCRFFPATRSGLPVSSHVDCRFTFRLVEE